MIIYIPDLININIDGIEFGCICTLTKCNCLHTQRATLVDVGLRGAQNGVDFTSYLRLVRKAVLSSRKTYAIVPDVFCDVDKTIKNFRKYHKMIKQVGAYTILVLQRFYSDIDAYMALLDEVDLVALPARRHCDIKCAERPRTCAERIERAMRALRNVKVHLLGPAAKTLKALGTTLKDVYSFDTSAYHMAPNAAAKKNANGKWQITSAQITSWLLEWLKVVKLPQVQDVTKYFEFIDLL